MSNDPMWPNGPPSDEELLPLYEEVMAAIERDEVAEGLAFKFIVGNLMGDNVDEEMAVLDARGALSMHEETAEQLVSRCYANWHAQMAMKQSLFDMAKMLGAEVKLDPESDLSKYRRGAPMKAGEARQLKDGDVVWWRFREYGEEHYRADGPYRMKWTRKEDGEMILDDGSSFAGDWQLGFLKDHEVCAWDDDADDMLFHAVLKKG